MNQHQSFLREMAFLRHDNIMSDLPNPVIDIDATNYITRGIKLGKLNVLTVYKINIKEGFYLLCLDDNNIIKLYAKLKDVKSKINNKQVFIIGAIEKSNTYKVKGAGRQIYEILISNYTLISDMQNTRASQKIWFELSKKYNVGILDIKTLKILKTNIDAEELKDNIWFDYDNERYKFNFNHVLLAGDIRLVVLND